MTKPPDQSNSSGSLRDSARLRADRDAAVQAAQVAMRDGTRLMRLLTILGEPLGIAALLDKALATLSELFASDIVVLVDPGGTGSFVPLAAVGLPEETVRLPFSRAETGHLAQAMRTGMPVSCDDARTNPEVDEQLRELGARRVVWLPVTSGGESRGGLILARCHELPFSHGDIGLLRAMAYRIGGALEQAQRRAQMEVLVDAGQRIGRRLDPATVALEAVRLFTALVGANAAALALTDGAGRVERVVRSGLDAAHDPLWIRLAGRCLGAGGSTPAEALQSVEMPSEGPAQSLIAVPLKTQEKVHGVLFAIRFCRIAFLPDAHQVATLYAAQVASDLENARLYQTSQDEVARRLRLEEALRQSKRQVEDLLAVRTIQLDDANLQILEQNRKYQDLYDAAPCGYYSLDASGVFLQVNATALKMLGYTVDEVVGRMSIPDVLASHCRGQLAGAWEALLERGEVRDHQMHFRRRDGSEFPGVLNCFVIRDEAGEVQSVRCALFDDSERVAKESHIADLNQELEKRAIAAEAASRAKSRFLATMSHEVRTPLNAIMGFTELLRSQVANPDQKDKLGKIGVASAQLLKIIDDVLELARADSAGSMMLERAEFAFDALLRRVVEPAEARARAKGLAFHLEMGLMPGVVVGDAGRVAEILDKLLDNAVKFTESGSVLVRGRVASETAAVIALRFEIQDTGIGIKPENLERIFSPFEQGDSSTTRAYGGAGLGLAIARHLARLMGGDVGVASTPCIGSTFWVTLCLGRPAQGAGESSPDDPAAALKRDFSASRILVVDDSKISQELMADLLSHAGLPFDLAEDGQAAIEKARRTSYAAILIEKTMPRRDGLDAAREIRRIAGYREVPIIAVTADTLKEDREACLAAGMTDYLTKPFDPHLLLETLLKRLAGSGRSS